MAVELDRVLPRLSPSSPVGDPKSPRDSHAVNDSDRHLTPPETRREKLISAICSIGLFGAIGELEKAEPTTDLAYRSWEVIRKKGRAAELVGTVYGPDGKQIPHTGFEPYFAGEPPEKIVQHLVALGKSAIRSFNLEHVQGQEARSALDGKPISHLHVIQVLEDLNCVFKIVRSRAEGNMTEHGYRFRDHTHEIVQSGGEYIKPVSNTTFVSLKSKEDAEALIILGQIGIVGHPALRAITETDALAVEECAPRGNERVEQATNRTITGSFPGVLGETPTDNPLSH